MDAVASEVIGFLHRDILTTRFAHERGLGIGILDKIEVVGENIEDVRLEFKKSRYMTYRLPDFFRKLMFSFAENVSSVEKDECKTCRICLESCPVSAITLEPCPLIDQEKCIKCYCCHELCPNVAVKLKTSLPGRMILKRMNYRS